MSLELRADPDIEATMDRTLKRLEAVNAQDSPAFGDAQEGNRKLLAAFARGGSAQPAAPLTIRTDKAGIKAGEPAAVWPGARRRLVWAGSGAPRLQLQ